MKKRIIKESDFAKAAKILNKDKVPQFFPNPQVCGSYNPEVKKQSLFIIQDGIVENMVHPAWNSHENKIIEIMNNLSGINNINMSADNRKEEDTTMSQTERYQREHLNDRVFSIYRAHDNALQQKFFMDPPKAPRTPEELIERITKGEYKLLDMKDRDPWYTNWTNGLSWRTQEADKEGYQAAEKLLENAFRTVQDDIAILDPKEALEKLRAFEALTF